MIPPRTVAVWLNDDVNSTRYRVQVFSDDEIPESKENMPAQMKGRFLELSDADALFMEAAGKRQMILNQTQVAYQFTFSRETFEFTATRL